MAWPSKVTMLGEMMGGHHVLSLRLAWFIVVYPSLGPCFLLSKTCRRIRWLLLAAKVNSEKARHIKQWYQQRHQALESQNSNGQFQNDFRSFCLGDTGSLLSSKMFQEGSTCWCSMTCTSYVIWPFNELHLDKLHMTRYHMDCLNCVTRMKKLGAIFSSQPPCPEKACAWHFFR